MDSTKNFEYDIEFFDREKEKQEILNILRTKPQFINFIYGPINSGKTTLITNLIEELPKDYVVFYLNLRGKSIINYGDFIRVLFSIEKNKEIKDIINGLIAKVEKAIYTSQGIPISESLIDGFLKKDSKEDVFEFLENYFKEISKTKIPVLIIDELQTIGDLKVNGYLIYKLFNFFIRLTKELHISHVFALSSDSLFIERVYSEAMLQGRANYVLVDDFDEETAKKFLEKYKFKEIDKSMKYFGGKPGDLMRIITQKNKNIDVIIKETLGEKKYFLRNILDKLLYIKPKINIGEEEISVERDKVIEILKRFNDSEKIEDTKMPIAEKIFLIRKNILFINPNEGTIKPQSMIDLIAIREILKEMKK